jgi:hypothetical protein
MAVENRGDLSRAGLQSCRYLSLEIYGHPMVLWPFGVEWSERYIKMF